jgi:ribosomal protein S18 acetylase RimI-like enzyme
MEVIRPSRTDEIDAVLDLWAESRSAAAATTDRREDVERLVDEGAVMVAEYDGALVGALIAAWDGWRGNMYRLAVRESHRRRGLGRALVEAGEDHLRRRGARRVTALIADEDDHAAALWRAAGYEHNPNIARYVRNI